MILKQENIPIISKGYISPMSSHNKQQRPKKSNVEINAELRDCLAEFFMDEYPIPMARLCPNCSALNSFNCENSIQICSACKSPFCFRCLAIKEELHSNHQFPSLCEAETADRQTTTNIKSKIML